VVRAVEDPNFHNYLQAKAHQHARQIVMETDAMIRVCDMGSSMTKDMCCKRSISLLHDSDAADG
jgi:hypothetical protein